MTQNNLLKNTHTTVVNNIPNERVTTLASGYKSPEPRNDYLSPQNKFGSSPTIRTIKLDDQLSAPL